MRILVTGSAGFIGSHLTDALVGEGHEVIGIDDLSTGRSDNLRQGSTEWHRADIVKPGSFDWVGDLDVIYHCAASYKDRSDWERDANTNVLGTINVVREAQRTNARLIYFQTSLCYGPNPSSPVPTDAPLDPHGSYAISKTAGEAFIRDSGLDWVSFRLANVYGPRNLSGPVPAFYQRLSQGHPCTVVDSRRDFVYINDLVRVAVAAAARGRGIYHVSSGRDISVEEVYYAVCKAMGIESGPVEIMPRGPDDVATLLLDPLDTYLEFGWAANTPLVTGIHKAVAWYRSHSISEVFTHLAPPVAART